MTSRSKSVDVNALQTAAPQYALWQTTQKYAKIPTHGKQPRTNTKRNRLSSGLLKGEYDTVGRPFPSFPVDLPSSGTCLKSIVGCSCWLPRTASCKCLRKKSTAASSKEGNHHCARAKTFTNQQKPRKLAYDSKPGRPSPKESQSSSPLSTLLPASIKSAEMLKGGRSFTHCTKLYPTTTELSVSLCSCRSMLSMVALARALVAKYSFGVASRYPIQRKRAM